MSQSTTQRVVWASAAYDFLVTFAFSTPWTALGVADALRSLHDGLGLSGHPPDLSAPLSLLFANLLGTLVCVWSIVRMRAPTREHGLADSATRILFAGWMTYALVHGASTVVAFFLTAELGWAVIQGAAVLPRRHSGSVPLKTLSRES